MAPLRVLVVDDNNDIRLLVKTWLASNYIVTEAIDGDDCLLKIKESDFDIILLDVMMPGPSSADLVKAITKARPNAKIIYLTSVDMFNPSIEQEKKGLPVLDESVKGYLIKPITKEQLIDKINSVINLDKLINESSKKLIKTKKK